MLLIREFQVGLQQEKQSGPEKGKPEADYRLFFAGSRERCGECVQLRGASPACVSQFSSVLASQPARP
jgi:hypothetical protein